MLQEKYNKIYKYTHLPLDQRDKHYNILLTLDMRLFNAMLVLIVSLVNNLKRPIHLYILQSDFTQDKINEVKNFCKLQNVNVDTIYIDSKIFENFYHKHTRFPKQVFYYFIAHQYLPESVKRILLLDIDTLVLKDLENLYDIDFEDSWLAGCVEYEKTKFSDYLKIKNNKYLYKAFFCNECLYNSGVLLLNIEKFRKNNISLKNFIDIQKTEDKLTNLPDQLLINRFTKDNVKLFPKLYYNCWSAHEDYFRDCFNNKNVSNEIYLYTKLNEKFVNSIIHFTAFPSYKPWHALTSIDNNGEFNYVDSLNKFQKQHITTWWNYALQIPSKNLAELISFSIIFQENRKFITYISKSTISGCNDLFVKSINYQQLPIIDKNFTYVYYPISRDKNIHYEFSFNDNCLYVCLHFERNWKTKIDIINEIIHKSYIEEKLILEQTNFSCGCKFTISDYSNFKLATSFMIYLIKISLPILIAHNLVSAKFLKDFKQLL